MFGNKKEVRTVPTEFNTSSDTYIPDPSDIRIVAGEDVLIITDDKKIGGLWAGVDNYDPCSGSDQKCFDAMRKLINENFDEACDSLLFNLKEHLYLINLADCENRGAFNRTSTYYFNLCRDKINVFYPIINHFVHKYSANQRIGFVSLPGDGTSIGLAHLCDKLRDNGFKCYIEEAELPLLYGGNGSVPAKRRDYYYEKFDASSYSDNVKLNDFFETKVYLLLQAMVDRVKERMEEPDNTEERKEQPDNKKEPKTNLPTFVCPDYKKLSEYGHIRTIADIIKELNRQNHYTDPEVLENDLLKVLEQYRDRGTVTQSGIDAVRCLVYDHSASLFRDNRLDLEELALIIGKIPTEGSSSIDEVFSIREKAKILYAVEFANKICNYSNPSNLIYDLQDLFWGITKLGWTTELLNDDNPHMDLGVAIFVENIREAWTSITSKNDIHAEATLDNDLLESYMFTDHEKKLKDTGLVSTLKDDYEEQGGCHSTLLFPKKPGSGPVYVIGDDEQVKKACHPSDDTLIQQKFYELGFLRVLLKNMVARHEYKIVDDYRTSFYIPTKDYTRPVFDDDLKEKPFDSLDEKIKFIKSYR